MEDGISENPSSLGIIAVRITYRKTKAELQVNTYIYDSKSLSVILFKVKILRAENLPTNYKTLTAKGNN